ncbi:hypothetical protein CLOM_g21869 [Closterium sp. NIES-68]|nr:hypothetical protein CLOM_g21869 [Closterium sp. NIES-68]GJP66483.1 hypothetical protein CLOP_g23410 [Closterium sp. NIES-67]
MELRCCLVLALLPLLATSVAATDVSAAEAQAGALTAQPAATPRIAGVDLRRVVLLSPWAPRAFLYKQFLTDAECDHIIARAAPKLERSGVVNNDDGSSFVSDIRTSSGTFIDKGADAVMQRVEQRISEWTFLPLHNQESLQVLRYTHGQKYEPHVDYFHDPLNTQRGGHRYATVLMYLNNVTLGGETVFPKVKDDTPKDDTWSDCAKGFLAVKPEKGDALLFFNLHPDGTPDPTSLHYACPVVEGVKWSAPKWIHVADFDKPVGTADAGDAADGSAGGDGACTDSNAYCQYWAEAGECEKNPVYMRDACRKACNICS